MKVQEATLLVVDDVEMNRDLLSRRLQAHGYRVFTAESGTAALETIQSIRGIDLVLLDIIMPGMDGYEVLKRIREVYSSTELSVMMVTAKNRSEDIVKALGLGADDFITRPIDFPVAMARIANQLTRRRAEMALRESEERYVLAAKGANEGLWDWDLRTNKVFYSDRWKTMLGYELDEIQSDIEAWFSRVHPDDLVRLKEGVKNHLAGEVETFSCEYRMLRRDGSWGWLLSRGQAVTDWEEQHCRIVGWQTDTALRVEHDALTSLPNRGLFLARIGWASAKQQRNGDQEYALLYLGVDRFKFVNETLGHAGGDSILRQIVGRLSKLIRSQDTLARMGGDEFAILFEDLNGLGTASSIADRIKIALGDAFQVDHEEVGVTVSIGIILGSRLENGEELLNRAHAAMELAKTNGKNTYEFYQEGMNATQKNTLKLENSLRKALEQDELYLVYQPQISTKTGKIVGLEALIRWNSKFQGMIPPNLFIPIAEETGLIDAIGDWVIREACRQSRAWQAAGLKPIRIAVNVSSRQFRNAQQLFQTVEQALKDCELAPRWLELELTESLLLANLEHTREQLDQFHQLGIHLSLDDFGTGYSSLSYLKKLPIDTLKIDQSFVRDIDSDPDDAAICSTIISMAHTLRMVVIAEGVETQEHRNYLKDLGCDVMQGYYFSRPASAEDMAKILREDKLYT